MKKIILTLTAIIAISAASFAANLPYMVHGAALKIRSFVIEDYNDILVHQDDIKAAVNIFDRYDTGELATFKYYVSAGDAYIYYALLMKGKNKDEEIRAYERGLDLRKDPESIMRLATCYKAKYNKAIKSDNIKQEIYYGERIYSLLKTYIAITGLKDEKWIGYREYFKVYSPDTPSEVN